MQEQEIRAQQNVGGTLVYMAPEVYLHLVNRTYVQKKFAITEKKKVCLILHMLILLVVLRLLHRQIGPSSCTHRQGRCLRVCDYPVGAVGGPCQPS